MIRWLAMSLVTLPAVAVASDFASPTPTTQPSVAAAEGEALSAGQGQFFDFARQDGQLEQKLREMESQLGQLRSLPQFRFDGRAMPFVNIEPFNKKPNKIDIHNLKPYGRSFRFNGLTVYVEPIAAAEGVNVTSPSAPPVGLLPRASGTFAGLPTSEPVATEPAAPTTLPTELAMSGTITPDTTIPMGASTSYLDVLSLKLKTHPDSSRICIGIRFSSREVDGAKLDLELLAGDGSVLAQISHVEKVGPEVVRQKGPDLDVVHNWNDSRAVWLELPAGAEKAVKFTLDVQPN